ncbi:MAG: MotA/TolQ/ExbB proton channel family protein [Opitutales bacterium]
MTWRTLIQTVTPAALLVGLMLAMATQHLGWGHLGDSLALMGQAARGVLQVFGITIVIIAILGVWLLKVFLKTLQDDPATLRKSELDLDYIGRTAPGIGLLGTIIALVWAGWQMAEQVAGGQVNAVLEIVPAALQALMSTLAGLVVQQIAEKLLHRVECKQHL